MSQQERARKTKNKKNHDIYENRRKNLRNHETNVISFLFIGLFLTMAIYLVYFNVAVAPKIINNPYNKMIDTQQDKVVRGNILACDGTVLASTQINEEGEEYRYYPFSNMYCHVVGLKSEKTGIEGIANFELLSTDGNIIKELGADLQGKKSRGNDCLTTLVPSLQEAAYQALGDNKGAVIAMEPSSGKILAMVSKPDYNPNDAAQKYEEWLSYDSSDSVLLNRATKGLYAPGSTFKVMTVLEYIRENSTYSSFSYECDGSAYIQGGTTIPCFDQTAHGFENLTDAFSNSCNSAFSTIGCQLDLEKFKKTCEDSLFNQSLKIGMDASDSSFELDANSGISLVQETSIGQGKTMISPIHNLMIISAIANEGVMMKPYLVDTIQTSEGTILKKTQPESRAQICTSDEASTISDLCRSVVMQGTGAAFRNVSYEVAGKTGTAQYDSSDNAHSWFVGFAPYDNPQISICVILEGGYTKVANAQQVAKNVLDSFFG